MPRPDVGLVFLPGGRGAQRQAAGRLSCRASREQTSTPPAAVEATRTAVSARNRKNPSAALYRSLVAYNQELGAEKARTRAVMEAIFALGPDNELTGNTPHISRR